MSADYPVWEELVGSPPDEGAERGDQRMPVDRKVDRPPELAGVTLVALGLDFAFGWWWADPAAALLIAAALATEAVRVTVRHVFG